MTAQQMKVAAISAHTGAPRGTEVSAQANSRANAVSSPAAVQVRTVW
jgi:hypothetical protein